MLKSKISQLAKGIVAGSRGQATPLGFQQSAPIVSTPVRNVTGYLSAGQPLAPVARPTQYETRRFDYQVATNFNFTPGDGKYPLLKALASEWNVLRSIIDTKKDLMAAVPWEIVSNPKPGESKKDTAARSADDPKIADLTQFFNSPNGEHTWFQWIRSLLDDAYIIDAASLRFWRDLSGKIASIDVISGDTINRVLDDHGRTPCEPSGGVYPVAYQQIVSGSGGSGGVPQEDLTVRDLMYCLRNPRSDNKWGLSSVEKIYRYAMIGGAADRFWLEYFSSGNQPPGIVFLPDLTPDQVKEYDQKFNAAISGNLGERRKVQFLPSGVGDKSPTFIATKEPLLKTDIYDDLVRFACYEFSVSPVNLGRAMNRASAEKSGEQAAEEGLKPDLIWLTQIMNRILQHPWFFGLKNYSFQFGPLRHADALVQMQVDTGYLSKGCLLINEVREGLGKTPLPQKEADMPGCMTPNAGFIPLDMAANPMLPGPEDVAGKAVQDDAEQNGKKPVKKPSGKLLRKGLR